MATGKKKTHLSGKRELRNAEWLVRRAAVYNWVVKAFYWVPYVPLAQLSTWADRDLAAAQGYVEIVKELRAGWHGRVFQEPVVDDATSVAFAWLDKPESLALMDEWRETVVHGLESTPLVVVCVDKDWKVSFVSNLGRRDIEALMWHAANGAVWK